MGRGSADYIRNSAFAASPGRLHAHAMAEPSGAPLVERAMAEHWRTVIAAKGVARAPRRGASRESVGAMLRPLSLRELEKLANVEKATEEAAMAAAERKQTLQRLASFGPENRPLTGSAVILKRPAASGATTRFPGILPGGFVGGSAGIGDQPMPDPIVLRAKQQQLMRELATVDRAAAAVAAYHEVRDRAAAARGAPLGSSRSSSASDLNTSRFSRAAPPPAAVLASGSFVWPGAYVTTYDVEVSHKR